MGDAYESAVEYAEVGWTGEVKVVGGGFGDEGACTFCDLETRIEWCGCPSVGTYLPNQATILP